MSDLQKPRRFFIWHRKLYWKYWTKYFQYFNEYDKKNWHYWEEWAVFVGLKSKGHKWFDYEDLYYDGHTCQTVVIAGICFGKVYVSKVYGYDAQPIETA